MKISYKQLLLILTTLYSATAYPLRGRWASAAIGYSAGKNSSGNTIDSMTQKQVNRHEKEINKLNAKLEKMEKKPLSDSDTKLKAEYQQKIKEHESAINQLLN